MGRLAAPLCRRAWRPVKGNTLRTDPFSRIVPVDMTWVGESCPSALQPLPPNRRRAENAHRAMRPEAARRPESLPNFSC